MTVPRPHDRPISTHARLTKPLKPSRCAYHSGPPSGCFAVILCYVPAIGSRHW